MRGNPIRRRVNCDVDSFHVFSKWRCTSTRLKMSGDVTYDPTFTIICMWRLSIEIDFADAWWRFWHEFPSFPHFCNSPLPQLQQKWVEFNSVSFWMHLPLQSGRWHTKYDFFSCIWSILYIYIYITIKTIKPLIWFCPVAIGFTKNKSPFLIKSQNIEKKVCLYMSFRDNGCWSSEL